MATYEDLLSAVDQAHQRKSNFETEAQFVAQGIDAALRNGGVPREALHWFHPATDMDEVLRQIEQGEASDPRNAIDNKYPQQLAAAFMLVVHRDDTEKRCFVPVHFCIQRQYRVLDPSGFEALPEGEKHEEIALFAPGHQPQPLATLGDADTETEDFKSAATALLDVALTTLTGILSKRFPT